MSFICREHRKKHVDGIDHKEGTITYRETRTFHYDKERSDGRLETERFTTVNIPMVVSTISNMLYKTNSLYLSLSYLRFLIIYESVWVNLFTFLFEKVKYSMNIFVIIKKICIKTKHHQQFDSI